MRWTVRMAPEVFDIQPPPEFGSSLLTGRVQRAEDPVSSLDVDGFLSIDDVHQLLAEVPAGVNRAAARVAIMAAQEALLFTFDAAALANWTWGAVARDHWLPLFVRPVPADVAGTLRQLLLNAEANPGLTTWAHHLQAAVEATVRRADPMASGDAASSSGAIDCDLLRTLILLVGYFELRELYGLPARILADRKLAALSPSEALAVGDEDPGLSAGVLSIRVLAGLAATGGKGASCSVGSDPILTTLEEWSDQPYHAAACFDGLASSASPGDRVGIFQRALHAAAQLPDTGRRRASLHTICGSFLRLAADDARVGGLIHQANAASAADWVRGVCQGWPSAEVAAPVLLDQLHHAAPDLGIRLHYRPSVYVPEESDADTKPLLGVAPMAGDGETIWWVVEPPALVAAVERAVSRLGIDPDDGIGDSVLATNATLQPLWMAAA